MRLSLIIIFWWWRNFSGLSDVDISRGLENGMVLVYNSSTSKWVATLELTPGATQNLDINGGNW